MTDNPTLQRYHDAFEAFKACREREQREYEGEYDRVKLMEHEAPAPDPCTEAYNEVIASLLDFSGDLDSLEMGTYRDTFMRALAAQKQG